MLAIFTVSFSSFFSLHLSANAQNVHFREAKFQNFLGEHAPGPPSILALSALDIIFARLTLKCFRRACYFQSIILSIILRIFVHKKMFLFSVEKGAPSVLYSYIYFKDCRHEVRSSLKCTPPPAKKAAYAPGIERVFSFSELTPISFLGL